MRRASLLAFLLACGFGQERPRASAPRHVKVYEEPGRFGGWLANHGIWSWGDEILVGFSAAWYQSRSPDRHQMDSSKPEEPRLARSLDGGETWTIESPASLLPPEQGGRVASTGAFSGSAAHLHCSPTAVSASPTATAPSPIASARA